MRWASFRASPMRQGELDHLCGLYALTNALRLLTGTRPALLPIRFLFGENIRATAREADLRKVVMSGVETEELWRITVRVVRFFTRVTGVGIELDRPFLHRGEPSDDEVRRAVAAGTRRGGTIWIVGLTGAFDHWTVVRRATRKGLTIADSSELKRLRFTSADDLDEAEVFCEGHLVGDRMFRLRLVEPPPPIASRKRRNTKGPEAASTECRSTSTASATANPPPPTPAPLSDTTPSDP